MFRGWGARQTSWTSAVPRTLRALGSCCWFLRVGFLDISKSMVVAYIFYVGFRV